MFKNAKDRVKVIAAGVMGKHAGLSSLKNHI